MRYLVVDIDAEDTECAVTFVGIFDDRIHAKDAAKEYSNKYPNTRTGVYEYVYGYSSAVRVDVQDEYYPPELPVEKAPESSNAGLTD